MRARFDSKQNKVTVKQFDKKDYIFLCANEKTITETPEGQGTEQTFYEYDYTEITEQTGVLDLEDVKENPEKYENYKAKREKEPKEEIEELKEQMEAQTLLIQYLAEMTDIYIPE